MRIKALTDAIEDREKTVLLMSKTIADFEFKLNEVAYHYIYIPAYESCCGFINIRTS